MEDQKFLAATRIYEQQGGKIKCSPDQSCEGETADFVVLKDFDGNVVAEVFLPLKKLKKWSVGRELRESWREAMREAEREEEAERKEALKKGQSIHEYRLDKLTSWTLRFLGIPILGILMLSLIITSVTEDSREEQASLEAEEQASLEEAEEQASLEAEEQARQREENARAQAETCQKWQNSLKDAAQLQNAQVFFRKDGTYLERRVLYSIQEVLSADKWLAFRGLEAQCRGGLWPTFRDINTGKKINL